jgi:hypothetical protein
MSLGAWSTRESFAKEFALWSINDTLVAFFRVLDVIKLSHNIFSTRTHNSHEHVFDQHLYAVPQ